MKKDTKGWTLISAIAGGVIGLAMFATNPLVALGGLRALATSFMKEAFDLCKNLAAEGIGEIGEGLFEAEEFKKLKEKINKKLRSQNASEIDWESNNDFKNIIYEISGEKKKSIIERTLSFIDSKIEEGKHTKLKEKITKKLNEEVSKKGLNEIIEITNDYWFNTLIENTLKKLKTYQSLEPAQKESVDELFNNLRDWILHEEYKSLEWDEQVSISILASLFDKIDKKIDKLIGYIGQLKINGVSYQEIRLETNSVKMVPHECPNCGYYGQHLYFNESNTKVYCAACGKEYSILKDLADSEEIKKQLDEIQKIIQTNNTNVQGEIKLLAETLLEKAYFEECLNNQTATIESAFANQKAYFEEIKIEETNNVEKICQRVSNEAVVAIRKLESLSEQVVSLYNLAVEKFENLTIGQEELLVFIKNSVTQEFLRSEIGAIGQDLKEYQNQNLEKQLAAMQGISDAGIAKILVAISDLSNKVRGNSEEKIKETINRESQKAIYEIQGLKELLDSRTHEIVAYLKMLEKKLEVELIATGNKSVRLSYNGLVPEEYLLNNGFSNKPFACPFCGKIEARELSHEQKCHCSTCGNTYWALDIFDADAKSFAAEHGRKEEINSLVKRVEKWRDIWQVVFNKRSGKIVVNAKREQQYDFIFISSKEVSIGGLINKIFYDGADAFTKTKHIITDIQDGIESSIEWIDFYNQKSKKINVIRVQAILEEKIIDE